MTFRDVWNIVSLHADVPDPLMCRIWVQWAYNEFCDRRGWSHLRSDTVISVGDQKAGVCGVTRGSGTVTAGTLTFASTDVGRQFRLGSIPIYTIIDVVTGNAVLNRVYSEVTNAAASAVVLDAYITMPEDFHRFISVLDPQNRMRLRWWVTQEEIDRWDPARTSTGTARCLASQAYSPVVGKQDRPRLEMYPFQTSARTYPVWYYRKPENLDDDTPFIGPLARAASSILLEGALSRCAMWPGTTGRKNPYFSLQLAETHRTLFEDKVTKAVVQDEELYFEGLPMADFGYADCPWDASWMQSHVPYIIG